MNDSQKIIGSTHQANINLPIGMNTEPTIEETNVLLWRKLKVSIEALQNIRKADDNVLGEKDVQVRNRMFKIAESALYQMNVL